MASVIRGPNISCRDLHHFRGTSHLTLIWKQIAMAEVTRSLLFKQNFTRH